MRILVALLISVVVGGCGSLNRADSQRMLDLRAGYDAEGNPIEPPLQEAGLEGFRNHPVPTRTREKVSPVFIHRQETAGRDYFWGGWMSVVTEDPQWVLTKPKRLPKAPGIQEVKRAEKKEAVK